MSIFWNEKLGAALSVGPPRGPVPVAPVVLYSPSAQHLCGSSLGNVLGKRAMGVRPRGAAELAAGGEGRGGGRNEESTGGRGQSVCPGLSDTGIMSLLTLGKTVLLEDSGV